MDAFSKFQHFISYFLPGVFGCVLILAWVSLLTGQDFLLQVLNSQNILAIGVVSGSALGLTINAFKNVYLDQLVERRWSSLEEQKSVDALMYEKFDLYQKILAEHYHYYEFCVHMLTVMVPAIVVMPWYISSLHYLSATNAHILIACMAAGIMVLYKYAKAAYQDFTKSCLGALEIV